MSIEEKMSSAETDLEAEIASRGPWFHNMKLGDLWTAPEHFLGNYPAVKWARFEHIVPDDLQGLSVLDIGCNAGFYSLEMKRRGAARVLGIDSDPRYLSQARLAADVLGLDVEYRELSVWDVARLHEKFDLVIFMGVFYHLRNPLLALDLIHEHVVKDRLLFQSMLRGSREAMALKDDYPFEEIEIFNGSSFPKMHFIEHGYCGDGSNWWVPNHAGMEAMLRSSGFRIESNPETEVYLCRCEPLSPDSLVGPVYPARP